MNRKFLSIKILTALAVFISSMIFGLGTYFVINSETKKNLLLEFDALLVNYALDLRRLLIEGQRFDILDFNSEASIEDKIFPFPHGKSLVQVVDHEGLIVDRSDSLGASELPIDEKSMGVAVRNSFSYVSVRDHDGFLKSYRLVQIPILDRDDYVRGAVQVAVPADFIDIQQDRLNSRLLSIFPVFLLLSVFISLVVSRAIAGAISKLVSQVTDTDRSQIISQINVPHWPSEIKELAEAFNKLIGQVKESNRWQEEFFMNATHQLKTPLFILKNEISQAEGVTVQLKAKLVGQTTQLSIVLQKILDFGRSAYRFSEDQVETAHLLDLASDTIVKLSTLAEKKNISIKLSAKENGDFLFLGEATLIQQSFQNLLDNAIKWSPKDQTVEVVLESEQKQLIVKILDHGPGVSEELIDKLFLPFVGDESFSDSTGLGLALVKRVAQLHGGYARYSRTLEGLTQFELVFLKNPVFMS